MSDIPDPHHQFVEKIFSRPDAARDFALHHLPREVVALLDLDSLQPTKDSFADAELRSHDSDLLFRVTLTKRRPGYLYLLFEHNGYADPDVDFQLLRYCVRIWEKHREGHSRGLLPPILPPRPLPRETALGGLDALPEAESPRM